MGFQVMIKLGDAASERVSAVIGDLARFRDVDEYVNELIERDAEDAFHQHPAVIAELQQAFAAPEEECEEWNVDDFLADGKRRSR